MNNPELDFDAYRKEKIIDYESDHSELATKDMTRDDIIDKRYLARKFYAEEGYKFKL